MFIISVHEKCILENFSMTFYAFKGGKCRIFKSQYFLFVLFFVGALNINKFVMGWVSYV